MAGSMSFRGIFNIKLSFHIKNIFLSSHLSDSRAGRNQSIVNYACNTSVSFEDFLKASFIFSSIRGISAYLDFTICSKSNF